MQLYKKLNICYQFCVAYLEFTPNFQQFGKKHQAHSSTILDTIDTERSCYIIVLKAML